MGGSGAVRLLIDRDRCEGYGLCEQSAPKLIHLDDDDQPMIDVDEIAFTDKPMADAAVRACPVAALKTVAATANRP